MLKFIKALCAAAVMTVLLCGCSGGVKQASAPAGAKVTLGNERLSEPEVKTLLIDKKIGLFTNQSGVDSRLNRTVDKLDGIYKLAAIFVPEHGLLGAVAAGKKFDDDSYNGIKVYSLYDDDKRPSAKQLKDIDVMVVDIQDVGIRHYTYFSSLAYIMEECAKEKKKVIVLDRPNPLGGAMEGPVLKPEYKSFIGLYALPLRHGLTIGEFARYINKEENIGAELEVVSMKGYKRAMLWPDTGLPWVMTSPQIPTWETAFYYGVTGAIGDSNLATGVGTSKPFYFAAASYAKAEEVKARLDALKIPGVAFRAAAFSSMTSSQVYQGAEIYLTDLRKVNLPELGYRILTAFRELYPEKVKFARRGIWAPGSYKIDIALGECSLREGAECEQTFRRWRLECEDFAKKAKPYLLYN